jgi:hypothetical protein
MTPRLDDAARVVGQGDQVTIDLARQEAAADPVEVIRLHLGATYRLQNDGPRSLQVRRLRQRRRSGCRNRDQDGELHFRPNSFSMSACASLIQVGLP